MVEDLWQFNCYDHFSQLSPILALVLPLLKKSGISPFLWLDLVNNVYANFYQNIPFGWRSAVISVFSYLWPATSPSSTRSGTWHVHWQDLADIYQYAKNYQNIHNGLSALAIFAKWPWRYRWTDGCTKWLSDTLWKSTIQAAESVNFSSANVKSWTSICLCTYFSKSSPCELTFFRYHNFQYSSECVLHLFPA